MRRAHALAALLAALPACRAAAHEPADEPVAAAPVAASAPAPTSPGRTEIALRPDWATCEPLAFERAALGVGAEPPGARLADADLAALEDALASQDQASIRAAVLLARSGDPRAPAVLIERLERRVDGPERWSDAADVVAAAALAAHPELAERLELLAAGPDPHPDLEVRVECAASALWNRRDGAIPFLLRVLRAGTPAQSGVDWTPTQTMAWAKGRAATALSERADVPLVFRPDASYEHQMREADRLEQLLANRAEGP